MMKLIISSRTAAKAQVTARMAATMRVINIGILARVIIVIVIKRRGHGRREHHIIFFSIIGSMTVIQTICIIGLHIH